MTSLIKKMNVLSLTKFALALGVLTFSTSALAVDKVVYGTDDRLDIFEVSNPMYLELAASTAAMIDRDKVISSNEGYTVGGTTLSQRGICSDAKFADQSTTADCSGFLVGEDLLVTAGHCIQNENDCASRRWVFNYAHFNSDITSQINVGADDVYNCESIVERQLDQVSKNDFALIKLDRKVVGRKPLKFRTEGKIEAGDKILVIGHPTGLPTKVADNAWVRNNDNSVYFSSNLDTFGGNSGSAVFNATTGEVEGILVRGENDYVYDWFKNCRVPNVCTDDSCRGEDVTRITNVTKLMQMVQAQ